MKWVAISCTSPSTAGDHMRAALRSCERSLAKLALTSGYWIFTTTCRPSSSSARCTCPMLAEPTGSSSIHLKSLAMGLPRPSTMMRRTSAGGLGGTPFCSTASCVRYWSGAIGAIEIAWPSLT